MIGPGIPRQNHEARRMKGCWEDYLARKNSRDFWLRCSGCGLPPREPDGLRCGRGAL